MGKLVVSPLVAKAIEKLRLNIADGELPEELIQHLEDGIVEGYRKWFRDNDMVLDTDDSAMVYALVADHEYRLTAIGHGIVKPKVMSRKRKARKAA